MFYRVEGRGAGRKSTKDSHPHKTIPQSSLPRHDGKRKRFPFPHLAADTRLHRLTYNRHSTAPPSARPDDNGLGGMTWVVGWMREADRFSPIYPDLPPKPEDITLAH